MNFFRNKEYTLWLSVLLIYIVSGLVNIHSLDFCGDDISVKCAVLSICAIGATLLASLYTLHYGNSKYGWCGLTFFWSLIAIIGILLLSRFGGTVVTTVLLLFPLAPFLGVLQLLRAKAFSWLITLVAFCELIYIFYFTKRFSAKNK